MSRVKRGKVRKERARRVLSHGDILQSILQHLDELFREFDALTSIAGSDVTENVAYGRNRVRYRA
jgi:hypothetical protein